MLYYFDLILNDCDNDYLFYFLILKLIKPNENEDLTF